MMKTWLIRRSVRRPVSRRAISREQFIGVQAALHDELGTAGADEFHRLGRRGVAVGNVDDLGRADVDAELFRDAADLSFRADEDRQDHAGRGGVGAPFSEDSSHGCATAVGTARISRAAAISRSYFACRRAGAISGSSLVEDRRRRHQAAVFFVLPARGAEPVGKPSKRHHPAA